MMIFDVFSTEKGTFPFDPGWSVNHLLLGNRFDNGKLALRIGRMKEHPDHPGWVSPTPNRASVVPICGHRTGINPPFWFSIGGEGSGGIEDPGHLFDIIADFGKEQ
jgi:hypothetical protein